MTQGWMKFAIQGSTYARALQNAATSGGRALSPAMTSKLTQMRSQPQAKLQPGLGQMFREHASGGELPMTPQIARMQNLTHQLPWAGEEHGGLPSAERNFNRTLESRGLVHDTPKGDTQQKITQSFGTPEQHQILRRGGNDVGQGTVVAMGGDRALPQSTRMTSLTPPEVQGHHIRFDNGQASFRGDTGIHPNPRPNPTEGTSVLPRQGAGDATNVLKGPAAAPAAPRQFPRARFQMGKVGSFHTGLERLVEAL
jgi:hypothetical protein